MVCLTPRVGVAVAEEITLDVDDITLLLLNAVVDVLEAVEDLLLLDEVVETMLDTLDTLDTTLVVEEMLLLLLDAKEERRYISNLFPAPQYS
jgi:hypothetical protein